MVMAEKVVSSKNIGPLSVSLDENGTLTMVAEAKAETIVLERPQAQELLQWLSAQRATLYELTKQGAEQSIGPQEEPDFGWQRSHPDLEEEDNSDIFPIGGVV
jgi:hypothetical protein